MSTTTLKTLKWINNKEFADCDRCDFKSPIEIEDLDSIKFVKLKENEEKECVKCGGVRHMKSGKFGDFWACTNYPDCNNSISVATMTNVKCPSCNKGEYIKKKTKTGKIMYGCSNFPNCKEVLWNKPLKLRCIHCSHTVLEEYSNGKKRCANPKCRKYND